MKKILVPVDFSECSDIALDQAAYLAELMDAELHLYHVAALHPYWRELSESDREAYKENLEIALQIEDKLFEREHRLSSRNLKVLSTYTHGPIIENVVKYAELNAIDLMVIGTHGMSGYKEWMIGSNTQKILRSVKCPVISIKNTPNVTGFKQIAFVSDFHLGSMKAFEQSLDFAELFSAGIHLINMDEPGFFRDPVIVMRQAMREFQDVAMSRGLDCKVQRLNEGDLEQGLRSQIDKYNIDLVVVPTHGRGSIARLFLSSIAEAIVNHMDTPVMTIKI